MLAPTTHFLAVTRICRTRLLPVPGRILVRKGQEVNATDVIAEARLEPEHLLLDLARGLGLPADKADQYIQHRVGDEVDEGAIIAGPVGVTRRVVRSPKPGRVVAAGSGQVLMEVESKPFELRAGIPGVVTELLQDFGVEIETTGALIQGVWGNGQIDDGVLDVEIHSRDDILTVDRLDVSQRGSIIFGGFCGDAGVLSMAAEIPLRGLLLASMDSALIPLAERMQYPIMVIEGLGKIPLNETAYKLLTTNERREVVVKAERWDHMGHTRPEVVIPLPAQNSVQPPMEMIELEPGQQVRIRFAPLGSEVGTIMNIRPGLTLLPSGIRAKAAEIKLENGESAVFPLINLEVLK